MQVYAPISIIIADDHPLFRTALSGTLKSISPQATIIESEDLPTLQACVEEHSQANMILLDLHMPGADGFSALIFLSAHYAHIPVIVVSAHDEPEIMRRALDYGASGFLPKSSSTDDMKEALDTVLKGGIWAPEGLTQDRVVGQAEQSIADSIALLTPQQFRVASMVSLGLLNKQIAYELDVTEATIKAHMTEIFKKLGVHSRTQVALAFSQLAVIPESIS
jgi:DNA-binding NarL/FixJ family response regulator